MAEAGVGGGKPKMVPIKPGLFKLPSTSGENGYLVGSKCRNCGEVFWPARIYCANCSEDDMEEVALGGKGKISTYTIVRQTLPGSVMTAPYGLGVVDLPEGAHVRGVFTDCRPEDLDIGVEVEAVIEKVKEDPEGNDVMAFKFRPVRRKAQ